MLCTCLHYIAITWTVSFQGAQKRVRELYNHIHCACLGLRSYKSVILQRSAKLGETVPIRLYPDRFLMMGTIKKDSISLITVRGEI